MKSVADGRGRFWRVAGAVVIVDLITKLLVEARFDQSRVLSLVGDWFRLRLVYNPGAAFGLHLGPYSRWIFLGIAALALVVLWRMARQGAGGDLLRQASLGLVAGGAAGNLVDRIRSTQGVVDFLDVGIGAMRWPTFNVADIGVTCGAIALAISLWQEDARRSSAESPTAS